MDSQRKIILNSEKISKNLIEADNSLNNNVIDALNVAIRSLEKIEDFNSEYKEKLSELKNVYYDVQEITREISHLRDENIFDESQRNEIEERLDLIFSLKRKYGNTIKEILEYKNPISSCSEKNNL